MLTLIPFDDSRVVGARISGKITRPEFDSMVAALEKPWPSMARCVSMWRWNALAALP